MLLKNMLLELRSNPEINKKESLNSKLTDILNSNTNIHFYVSLTEKDKLGIYPKSSYETPIGIYAYPLTYVINVTNGGPMTRLPFAGHTDYVNVFSSNGYILDIRNVDESMLRSLIVKIKSFSLKKYGIRHEIIDQFVSKSGIDALKKSPGGRLWYITRELSIFSAKETQQRSVVMWNVIFRGIGIDGVVDHGAGIIHTNEPTQAVFFAMSSIQNLKRFDNRHIDDHINKNKNDSTIKVEHIRQLKAATTINDNVRKLVYLHPDLFKYVTNKDVRHQLLLDPDVSMKLLYEDIMMGQTDWNTLLIHYYRKNKLGDVFDLVTRNHNFDLKTLLHFLLTYSTIIQRNNMRLFWRTIEEIYTKTHPSYNIPNELVEIFCDKSEYAGPFLRNMIDKKINFNDVILNKLKNKIPPKDLDNLRVDYKLSFGHSRGA